MCGRFNFDISPELLTEIFGISVLEDISPHYNIAPSQRVLIIRRNGTGNLSEFLRWGLIPSWSKDTSSGNSLINARSESVHEKPSFRQAIRYRRCIIPASGYFEWENKNGQKQPYYIRMKDDSLMGLAGIWETWKSAEGEELRTCAILTTSPNRLVQTIHDRMPVILHPEEYNLWLDRNVTDPEKLKPLYQPYPSDLMEMYPVSSLDTEVAVKC